VRKWFMVAALACTLVFANGATGKGCAPEAKPGATKKPGPVIVEPDHGFKMTINITWTIRGVQQRESHPAAPGGIRDRVLTAATRGEGPNAEVTARQDNAGLLLCLITYVKPSDGKIYNIDYEHSNVKGAVVHCEVNRDKLNFALSHFKGKTIPQPVPEGCSCDPDTIVLNVTWTRRG
jgi:hypothetical protein